MSKIIEVLNFEEGFRENPYIDTEGYPTVGTGFLIGPKGAALSNYQFTLPKAASDAWLDALVKARKDAMNKNGVILNALRSCNDARADVLISMAYQMGVNGLAAFKNTLSMVAEKNFDGAAAGMMNSLWARQTPGRAKRHAEVMRSGTYDAYKGLI